MNGHFGGCQKCHMKLVKSKYESGEFAFGKSLIIVDTYHKKNSNTQKCMMCRRPIFDDEMGVNWLKKLSKMLPLMMHAGLKKHLDSPPTLAEFLKECGEAYAAAFQDPSLKSMIEDNTAIYAKYTKRINKVGIKQFVKEIEDT